MGSSPKNWSVPQERKFFFEVGPSEWDSCGPGSPINVFLHERGVIGSPICEYQKFCSFLKRNKLLAQIQPDFAQDMQLFVCHFGPNVSLFCPFGAMPDQKNNSVYLLYILNKWRSGQVLMIPHGQTDRLWKIGLISRSGALVREPVKNVLADFVC